MREDENISPGGTARFVGDLPTKQSINKNVNAARCTHKSNSIYDHKKSTGFLEQILMKLTNHVLISDNKFTINVERIDRN
jgi:hypothetical protein